MFSVIKKYLLLNLVFFNLVTVQAQKYISGEISQNVNWRGDIYINGDIVIPRGITLSVEGGSRILFKPQTDAQNSGKDPQRAELIVSGILQIRDGNAQNKVVFTSESTNPQMNDWYGIVIKNLNDKSIIENTIIEFGYKGITCYGSAPVIKGCEIQFNHNSGISCEVRSAPEISKCVLFGNGFAGVNCELASNPVISECTITQNNYGVIIFSRSAPDLGSDPRTSGKSKGNNRIYNNFEYDIYNHAANMIYAQNNVWNTNSTSEIQQRIYDRADNGAYGEVQFQPLHSTARSSQFPKAIALTESQTQQSATDSPPLSVADTALFAQNTNSSQEISSRTMVDTLRRALNIKSDISNRSTTTSSETLIAAEVEQPTAVKANAEAVNDSPKIKEPVLEPFLDSGKREYVHRIQPTYPEIYLKIGKEGVVLMEVIVNKQGRIDEYRIIQSDGDLFSAAAVKALNKYIYKPGTVKGEPVKFKVIERFRFKINYQ
jgi:TonB family protein